MLKGGYKTKNEIIIPYEDTIEKKPDPIYKYPEGHPCHGCVFIFQTNKPSCMTGNADPKTCINTFYKKMISNRKNKNIS